MQNDSQSNVMLDSKGCVIKCKRTSNMVGGGAKLDSWPQYDIIKAEILTCK